MQSQQTQLNPKDKDFYNASDVEALTGISQATIRKYIQHYKPFLTIKKGAKNRNLFTSKSMGVLVKIKSLTQDGYNRKQIKSLLSDNTITGANSHTPNTSDLALNQDVHRSQDLVVTDNSDTTKAISELNTTIHELVTELQKTREEYKSMKYGFYFIQDQLDDLKKPWWIRLRNYFKKKRAS
jgi:DNA-binding transcriptional MerR regulator